MPVTADTTAARWMAAERGGEGIEEEKEEFMDVGHHVLASGAECGGGGVVVAGSEQQQPPLTQQQLNAAADDHGFRAQLESFMKVLFGSCGSVIEAAVHTCRVCPGSSTTVKPTINNNLQPHLQQEYPIPPHEPAYSIPDELRRLAVQNPLLLAPRQNPRTDIPKFLGEDAVYSFEDDNISAISAHTLEEMERRHKQKLLLHPAAGGSSGGTSSGGGANGNGGDHSNRRSSISDFSCPSLLAEPPLTCPEETSVSKDDSRPVSHVK